MPRTTPSAGTQPRKTTAESRRDNRRLTIDAMFARLSSQAPSSSPPGPSQSEGRLSLSAPRAKKLAEAAPPASRTRASVSRSSLAAPPSENARSSGDLSRTPGHEQTPATRTRSSSKHQNESSTEGASAGREHLASATTASRKAKTVSQASKPISSGQTTPHVDSLTKSKVPRKRALPPESDQADATPVLYCVPTQAPTPQTRTSPRRTARSAVSKPLTSKDNVLPSPSDSGSSRKRPRLTPPEEHCGLQPENLSQVTDPYEVVPSSQSDEQELTLPNTTRKDPVAVNEAVDQWRRGARTDVSCADPSTPLLGNAPEEPDACSATQVNVPMDIDEPGEDPLSPLSSIPTGLQTPTSEPDLPASSPLPYTLSSPSSCHTELAPSAQMATSSPSSPVRATPASILSMGGRPFTPPSDGRTASGPATPVALNEESKTAQIIAEIKARAYATLSSSPGDIPVELKELGYGDSSSDESEEDFMETFNKLGKGKGKGRPSPSPIGKKVTRFTSPALQSRDPPESSTERPRYGLRRKASGTKGVTGNKRMPTLVSTSRTGGKQSRKADPLEALLKEKQRADKRGGGVDALRAAEAAIISSSKEKQDAKAKAKASLKHEMDEEDSSDVDPAWTNESAAMDVVKKGARRFKSRSSSPLLGFDWDEDSDDESDGELEAVRQQALAGLGKEGGQKVGHILAGNRLLREAMSKVKLRDDILGVPLWDNSPASTDDGMDVDNSPVLSFDEADLQACPILGMLQDAVRAEDVSRLSMLLHSGVLSTLQPSHAAALVPWLYAMATDLVDRPYTELAYHGLLHLAGSISQARSQPGFSAVLLADTLVRLGAKSSACDELSQRPSSGQTSPVDTERRDQILYRVISFVTVLAREGALLHVDMPIIVLLLVLVAVDRATSPELGRDIMVAIEVIGQAIPANDEGMQIEAAIHSRLVEFAKQQVPMNQAHLLSFVSGACAQTSRIACNVARALLLKEETYTSLPSLIPVVNLLCPPVGSGGIFDIQGNTDKPDYYEDLCVDGHPWLHCAREGGYGGSMPPSGQGEESPKKGAVEREPAHLEQIKTLLDSLHGRIIDTRAAFLDRSRAKAALQRLSLRVHYQRMASLRSGPGTGRPRNLRNYFAQPKASYSSVYQFVFPLRL
ncbi:uncharacterized protein B0H18DRAFT_1114204 [Fomitopsis serialis]|uniref:uncharacterized protein n=1 Tax=Fomitopsis serialis TaxID=139415 RepID=UPI002008EAD3|nr:uncharacterized protein B0H18DRAFT_1114204 [Neoantrodia serialis]KAH9935460.1 hypothetical protein B0H18DRAFT_1114204 [Neoantrodia serialis]